METEYIKTTTSHTSGLDDVSDFDLIDAMFDNTENLRNGSEKFEGAAKLDFSEKTNNVTFIEVMNLLLDALGNVSDLDKDLTILDLIIKYQQVIIAVLNLPEHERNLCILEIQKSKPQIFSFLQKKSADVLKLITSVVANREQSNGEEAYKQIAQNVSESVDSVINKPRKNKYGLVMSLLEQELDNIKLGFIDITRFDPDNPKHGNAYRFFRRTYSKYQKAGVVYQDDILIIDPKLLNGLKNFFQRKTKKNINDYLPSRTHKTKKIVNKINTDRISKDALSGTAISLLRHHAYEGNEQA